MASRPHRTGASADSCRAAALPSARNNRYVRSVKLIDFLLGTVREALRCVRQNGSAWFAFEKQGDIGSVCLACCMSRACSGTLRTCALTRRG